MSTTLTGPRRAHRGVLAWARPGGGRGRGRSFAARVARPAQPQPGLPEGGVAEVEPGGNAAFADDHDVWSRTGTALATPTAAAATQAPPTGSTETEADSGAGGLRFSWRPRQIVLMAIVSLALGVLAYANRDAIDILAWRDELRPGWLLLVGAGSALSLAGNAWNLIGASPTGLPFRRTFAAQAAGTPARLVSPAALGGAAVNVQYLRRAGVGNVAAVGTVSLAQVIQLLASMLLLPVVAWATHRSVPVELPGTSILAVVAGAALLVGVVGALVVRRYPMLEARMRVAASELVSSLRALRQRPTQALVSIGGAVLISAGLIGALWASVYAFGGEIALPTAAFVLLLGSTAGNAVPIPGGLGTVDAALAAALGAAGVGIGEALPAVVLFRLATLWFQLPVGLVCFGVLRRRGHL